jgi:hypothetical protein
MYLQPTQGYGSLIPGSEYIRSVVRQGTISPEAGKRLRWMDHYAKTGCVLSRENTRKNRLKLPMSPRVLFPSAFAA